MRTAIAAVLLALVAVIATYTVHAAGTRALADLTTAGFGLAVLIAWPLGTFIFTDRHHRRRRP